MTRIAYLASALGLVLSTAACRSDDDPPGGPDGGGGSDGPPVAGEVTIQEVQNDAMASGTAIELKGVVVVAIDAFGNRTGDLFVSEPEGGPFSGVKVFGASLDQIATLQPGDLVDITGAKKHEGCNMESPCGTVVFENGASITEVMPVSQGSMQITKVGTGTVPTPTVVDAKAIAALPTAERIAEWEKYEGVLIKVTNARQLNDTRTFGSNPGPDSNEFRITGVARVQSVLTELPNTAVAGTCFDSITGVADFFFNYIVAPRSAADLVGGGTGCLPAATSIAELQSATTVPEFVKLTDVYVTAITFNKKNYWVSTSPTAAAGQGVQVFYGTGMSTPTLPAELVVGKKVTVLGTGAEFAGTDNMGPSITQISSPSQVISADAPVTVTPVANPPTIAMLQAAATGEPYEGVLVRLQNVKVTALGTDPNYVATLSSGGTTFKADDDVFRFSNATNTPVNTCYSSIVGVWSFSPFIDEYVFNARASAANAMLPEATVAANQTDCD